MEMEDRVIVEMKKRGFFDNVPSEAKDGVEESVRALVSILDNKDMSEEELQVFFNNNL